MKCIDIIDSFQEEHLIHLLMGGEELIELPDRISDKYNGYEVMELKTEQNGKFPRLVVKLKAY